MAKSRVSRTGRGKRGWWSNRPSRLCRRRRPRLSRPTRLKRGIKFHPRSSAASGSPALRPEDPGLIPFADGVLNQGCHLVDHGLVILICLGLIEFHVALAGLIED